MSPRFRKIIIAMDSFKGSLTSREAGEACRAGILEVSPDAEVKVLGVADGGEGTVDALRDAFGNATEVRCVVSSPDGSPVDAGYIVSADGKTALMEMAAASGLCLVPEDKRNPLTADSRGTGEMLLDAARRGCRNIIIGIGGSATVDGGMGMLAALGVRFFDGDGKPMESFGGSMLGKVASVDLDSLSPLVRDIDITVICDVGNPLCGDRGAVRVFAPQKGATQEMMPVLEWGMDNYARVMDKAIGGDLGIPSALPGAGAAGGVGYALCGVLHADNRPGIDVVLQKCGFRTMLSGCDLVMTGEGSLDRQTLYGKVAAGVLRIAREEGVPVVALGGKITDVPLLRNAGFSGIFSVMHEPCTNAEAMRRDVALDNVSRCAAGIIYFAETLSDLSL